LRTYWQTTIITLVMAGCTPQVETWAPGTVTVGNLPRTLAPILPTVAPGPSPDTTQKTTATSPPQTTPAANSTASFVTPPVVAVPQSSDGEAPRYGEKVASVPNVPVISYAQYQLITIGMSYETIAGIFGRRGAERSYVRSGDVSAAGYRWSNADGSYVDAYFSNDRMTVKTNYNLR
jgi:hypothetical protein